MRSVYRQNVQLKLYRWTFLNIQDGFFQTSAISAINMNIFLLGCLIDFDRREVVFSLNGRSLDPFRKLFSSTSAGPINDGYFAAASFMSYQHCRFNFGSIQFRYPPTTV